MLTPNNLWEEYTEKQDNSVATEKKYTSWYFCDNEACANELLELVLKGIKRATSSALWTYENEAKPIPALDDMSIVTKWNGEAKCIIKTLNIEIVPFIQVTKHFAKLEGEGNKSLEEWRQVHWQFFTRELSSYGKSPKENMPVVCETFELVYRCV